MPQPVMGPDGKPQVDAQGRGVFAVAKEQRPEADVNVEFQIESKLAAEAMKLAFQFKLAGEKYATDYPVNVGPHMTNTDSGPFMDIVPSLSLREPERGADDAGRRGAVDGSQRQAVSASSKDSTAVKPFDAVLREMTAEMSAAPEIVRASKYWVDLNRRHTERVSSAGIANFKRTLAKDYFTWMRVLPW